ncbi:substrate-binding domain-containing protein [Aquimarina sp. M1]
MKNLHKGILSLYIFVFVGGCGIYAPKNKELTLVLSQTQQTITSLEEKIIASEEETLKEAYKKLSAKSAVLFPVLENCNDKYGLAPEYVTTLQETEKTLRRLVKEYATMPNKAFVLDAVYQDYEAKLQTINNTAKNDATTKIKVIVNSSEDEGFFVFGKLSYEQGQRIKRFRFNQPTQNAVQDFVPGYYLFWLEKGDRVGEPELHLIMSSSGEEEKQLVLKTPK